MSKKLPKDELKDVGYVEEERERSGSFLFIDESPIVEYVRKKGVEITSLRKALKEYPWLKKISWSLICPETDKYTRISRDADGLFLRVEKGRKVTEPIQACYYMSGKMPVQTVHNVVVVEDDAELHLITGCTVARGLSYGLHIGVSEYIVGKNAKLTFTMIHSWIGQNVQPRAAIKLSDNSTFMSNYIVVRPSLLLNASPKVYLEGINSRAELVNLLVGRGKSKLDVGGELYFKAPEAKGNIVSRVVAKDEAKVIARSYLRGEAPDTRGHVECIGLLLDDTASIRSIPELDAKTTGSTLTHEAAIGKLAEEEIIYLMSRGLSRDEAVTILVRGFMNIEKYLEQLPETVLKYVKGIIKQVSSGL